LTSTDGHSRIRRAVTWLWSQRIAIFALALSLTIEATIVITQVPYYASLPGMAPTLAGVLLRIYWMMPIITGGLTLFYGAMAAYVIAQKSGHYRRYLRLMWLFASIGALVNVTHSLRLLGGDEWITALVLGGGSLASPLVLHSWTGLRLAITSGHSLADLVTAGRRWLRHPVLSVKFTHRLDLFPELHPSEVWEMTTRRSRERVLSKLNRPVREHRAQRGGEDEIHSLGSPVNSAVNQVNSLSVPAETESETTAERHIKQSMLIGAYYVVNEGRHQTRTQKFISDVAGASPSYTSRIFRECQQGKHPRPDDAFIDDMARLFDSEQKKINDILRPR
jgi:hypothetical protein